MVFERSLKSVSGMFQGCFNGVPRKFQKSFEEISRVFEESLGGVSRKIEGCLKKFSLGFSGFQVFLQEVKREF